MVEASPREVDMDIKIKSPPTFELFMPPSNPLARGIGTLSYRRFAAFLNTYNSEK